MVNTSKLNVLDLFEDFLQFQKSADSHIIEPNFT